MLISLGPAFLAGAPTPHVAGMTDDDTTGRSDP
jgi:hypothetical protein